MERVRKYFCQLFCPLLCMAAFSLVSCNHDKVIPRKDMVKIYTDMFLLDATIDKQRNLNQATDTSRVYAAILEKYGYTEDDFLKSQEKYIRDANRYARMIKKSQANIEKELKVLKDEREEQNTLRMLAANKKEFIAKFAPDTILLFDTAHISYLISLDSLLSFDFYAKSDTVYSGPKIIVKSLLQADTLSAASDSTAGRIPVYGTVTDESEKVGSPFSGKAKVDGEKRVDGKQQGAGEKKAAVKKQVVGKQGKMSDISKIKSANSDTDVEF